LIDAFELSVSPLFPEVRSAYRIFCRWHCYCPTMLHIRRRLCPRRYQYRNRARLMGVISVEYTENVSQKYRNK
jgi:hypothetical protein